MSARFKARKFLDKQVTKLRLDASPILVAVSGGIDSSVCTAVLKLAGNDVRAVFLDTGFLRSQERGQVAAIFRKMRIPLTVLDISSTMVRAIAKAKTSKEKRQKFRRIYFKALTQYAAVNNIRRFAQGTQFYGSQSKIYHNKPINDFRQKRLIMVEVVKGLAKSDIRKLAELLNLPISIVKRRPFPGPGLLIRFEGGYSPTKLRLVQQATLIVDEFVRKHEPSFEQCYQIFPYLSDSTATYVNKQYQGDVGQVLLIRSVRLRKSDHAYAPFVPTGELQAELAQKLMNVPGIARVCWDVTIKYGNGSKVRPGATIEYQ